MTLVIGAKFKDGVILISDRKVTNSDSLKDEFILKTKEPPKPVTNSELEQLTLQARKEELLTRIATAKAKRKGTGQSVFESIQKVIGKSTSNPFDMSASSKKRSDYDPFRW